MPVIFELSLVVKPAISLKKHSIQKSQALIVYKMKTDRADLPSGF